MTKVCLLIVPSLILLATGGDGDVLFREGFDANLQSGWQWVRENKDEWRIHDGELQVRSQHSGPWGGKATNMLLARPMKQRDMAACVSVAHQPKRQYEQAGLLWYVDDDNFVKLVSERVNGKMCVVVAWELDGRRRKVVGKVVVPSANIQLRLQVRSNRVTGQWRLKDTDAWSESGSCDFDTKVCPRFGIFTQSGEKDKFRWVWFDDFVITGTSLRPL